jgi:hypothetical protein
MLAAAGAWGGCDGRRGGAMMPVAMPDLSGGVVPNPNDRDGDGYTPALGDCNDDDSRIGPIALELANNAIDDDCDGTVDEPVLGCETGVLGKKAAADLATALGFCEPRFLLDAQLVGPSDPRARDIVATFGAFPKMDGEGMVYLSTGVAADKASPSYVQPQDGTHLGAANTFANPDLTITGSAECGSMQPLQVNDYTELALTLRVPQNVNSLRFQFHFFSAEYPEFVCTAYNDEFLVELESSLGGNVPRNISFDSSMNPITINNGFFTICSNDTAKPQTQHCTRPVDDLAGTGYEVERLGKPIGGSTGWLTTTAPVFPGDTIKLRFIVFDQGDHIFDSAVLLDAFSWSPEVIAAPVTVP